MNDDDGAARTIDDNPMRQAERDAQYLREADDRATHQGHGQGRSPAGADAAPQGEGAGYLDRLARDADALLDPGRPPRT